MKTTQLPFYPGKTLPEVGQQPLDKDGKIAQLALSRPDYQRYGTIVPWHWKAQFREKYNSIGIVMADILAYVAERWKPITSDRGHGETIARKSFRYNLPQLSYWYIAKQTGWSQAQIKRAVQQLESAGQDGEPLLKRFLQPVQSKESGEVVNKLFFMIYPDAIERALGWQKKIEVEPDTDYEFLIIDGEIVDELPASPLEADDDQDEEETEEKTEDSIKEEEKPGREEKANPPSPASEPSSPPPAEQPTSSPLGYTQLAPEQIDKIIWAQKTGSEAEVKVILNEFNLMRKCPPWRNSWSSHDPIQLKPDFVDFVEKVIAKTTWSTKPSARNFILSRESGLKANWEELLCYWNDFVAASTAKVSVSQEEAIASSDTPSLENHLIVCLMNLEGYHPPARLEAAYKHIRKIWDEAKDLGISLTKIWEEYEPQLSQIGITL